MPCPWETFKDGWDGALKNLIYLKMILTIAGWLDWMTFKGNSQPKLFYDSVMILQQIGKPP